MSESSKAVFLSYASQDAEAVARIAEALRGTPEFAALLAELPPLPRAASK